MRGEFIFEQDLHSITETEVSPKGWYPVTIEYGVSQLGQSQSWQMCWRVKGTDQVFRIPLEVFYENAQEDYEGHFKEVLETFRIDYLDWYKQGFPEPWMQRYRRMFKDYIYTFK